MKKLMIAAAIACAAVVSQAASVTWSAWGYENGDPSNFENWYTGGQAYLVLVSDTSTFAVTCDNGSWDIKGGSIVASADILEGSISGAWGGAEATLADNSINTFAVIMTTTGEATTKLNELPTDGYWGVSPATAQAEKFVAAAGGDWAMDASFNDGNGVDVSTAVAPEPTSGLLLILGVAGLALRRRRA